MRTSDGHVLHTTLGLHRAMTSVTLFSYHPRRTDAGLAFSDRANFGEALQDRFWVFIRLLEVLSKCICALVN